MITLFYTTTTNQGYTTTLTIANISREFRTEVLGEILDETDRVLTENDGTQDQQKSLLLLNLTAI